MSDVFNRIQTVAEASVLGQSPLLIGVLSGVHLIGLTLVLGGAFVSGLRFLGLLLPDEPADAVVTGPVRGISVGLLVSVTSGLLLVAPRVAMAADSTAFRVKMLLLCAAAAFHVLVYRTTAQATTRRPSRRAVGPVGMSLWLGVALAGCAFILLE